jgi:hypothetical protein
MRKNISKNQEFTRKVNLVSTNKSSKQIMESSKQIINTLYLIIPPKTSVGIFV